MPTAPGPSVDITLSTGSTVSRHIWLRAVLRASRAARLGINKISVKRTVSALLSLLPLSGDVELNPGPVRHPCRICDRPVKCNQRGVQCECCYYWLHTKCMHLSNEEYDLLCQSDEAWCCPDCLKQALPYYHDCSHISSGSTFTGNTILP